MSSYHGLSVYRAMSFVHVGAHFGQRIAYLYAKLPVYISFADKSE